MANGLIPEARLSLLFQNPKVVFTRLAYTEINALMLTNRVLLDDSAYLTNEQQQRLFLSNIQVLDSTVTDSGTEETYTYLNTFQAVDKLVSHSIQALSITKTNITAAWPLYQVIFKNSLNDILIKSGENLDVVADSLTLNREAFIQKMAVLSFLLIIGSLILILLACLTLKVLYDKEVNTLFHFSKLSNESIQKLASQVEKFKNMISEEKDFQEISLECVKQSSRKVMSLGTNEKLRNEKHNKSIRTTSISLRYTKSLGSIILIFLYMIVTTAVKYCWLVDALSVLYSDIEQLKFSRYLQQETTLALNAFAEAILTNGTSTILGVHSDVFFPDSD